MYQLIDVKKTYLQGDTHINVLKGLNFQIKEGESISIIGQSGSGKSTLLSVLSGLESVNSGQILFEESDLTNKSEEELTHFRASKLGIIFQHFHLVPHLTALENILLPLEILGIDNEVRGIEMLERVGLGQRGNHLPSQLSGGEMQRVAVARALVGQPKIILADEPSGNLDRDNAKVVTDLMLNLTREEKTALILVTHDQNLAQKCEKKLHLFDGCLS
jgi:putative ABC transport system ATP-binding protein